MILKTVRTPDFKQNLLKIGLDIHFVVKSGLEAFADPFWDCPESILGEFWFQIGSSFGVWDGFGSATDRNMVSKRNLEAIWAHFWSFFEPLLDVICTVLPPEIDVQGLVLQQPGLQLQGLGLALENIRQVWSLS